MWCNNLAYFGARRSVIHSATDIGYGVLTCLVFKVFYPNQIGMKDIIVSFLPITTQQYWFFTAYFAMFLVSPMINMFVHRADEKISIHAEVVYFEMYIAAVYGTINYMVTKDDIFVLSERRIGEYDSELFNFICFTDGSYYGDVGTGVISENSYQCYSRQNSYVLL